MKFRKLIRRNTYLFRLPRMLSFFNIIFLATKKNIERSLLNYVKLTMNFGLVEILNVNNIFWTI